MEAHPPAKDLLQAETEKSEVQEMDIIKNPKYKGGTCIAEEHQEAGARLLPASPLPILTHK